MQMVVSGLTRRKRRKELLYSMPIIKFYHLFGAELHCITLGNIKRHAHADCYLLGVHFEIINYIHN